MTSRTGLYLPLEGRPEKLAQAIDPDGAWLAIRTMATVVTSPGTICDARKTASILALAARARRRSTRPSAALCAPKQLVSAST